MKLKQLLSEERAVSPVIGVILMVAITVILAAVIGTFVLGLGENVQTTPQAKFNFDYNEGAKELTITHDGGDAIQSDEMNIVGNGTDVSWTNSLAAGMSDSYEVQAGNSTVIDGSADGSTENLVGPGDTIRVVWSDPNTDKSATLARWSGPDA